MRYRGGWLVALILFAACTTGGPTQSSPASATVAPASPALSPTQPAPTPEVPSPTAKATIVLRQAPANLGCDAIGIDYKSLTFDIDPEATEQVSAEADTGVTLQTYWSAGFQPGTDAERTVRDPGGLVVVADGDVLQVPAAGFPRLAGYFVCLAPDKLFVLLEDPS